RVDGDLRPDGDAGVEHDPGLGGDAMSYLPKGLPSPVVENDGIDKPYWEGTRKGELRVQRCTKCGTFRWERPWHPVHPALKGHGPYVVVLVELPDAGNVRMLGNLLGDPQQEVKIGAEVQAVFEPHE